MKRISSVASTLAILATIGGCGLGNGRVEVSLECTGTEESVHVSNPSNRYVTLKSITSSHPPTADPEVDLGGITGRDNGISAMLPRPIFDDDRDESARVEMDISGRDVVLEPSCSRPAVFDP